MPGPLQVRAVHVYVGQAGAVGLHELHRSAVGVRAQEQLGRGNSLGPQFDPGRRRPHVVPSLSKSTMQPTQVVREDAQPAKAQLSDRRRRRPRRPGHLPLQQIQHHPTRSIVARHDPRVPLHLVQPERPTRLRPLRPSPNRRLQPHQIPIEPQRPLQIRTIHIHMKKPQRPYRHVRLTTTPTLNRPHLKLSHPSLLSGNEQETEDRAMQIPAMPPKRPSNALPTAGRSTDEDCLVTCWLAVQRRRATHSRPRTP